MFHIRLPATWQRESPPCTRSPGRPRNAVVADRDAARHGPANYDDPVPAALDRAAPDNNGGLLGVTPPAHRRVLLLLLAEVREHLVAADIERAEGDGPAVGRVEHLSIEALLLFKARKTRRHHELQLGPEEADAGGAQFLQARHVHEQPGIDIEGDFHPVARHRRLVPDQPVLLLLAGAEAHLVGIGGLDVGRRPEMHLAGVAVDDDRIARFRQRHDVVELPGGGDAERARDDRDMARRPPSSSTSPRSFSRS